MIGFWDYKILLYSICDLIIKAQKNFNSLVFVYLSKSAKNFKLMDKQTTKKVREIFIFFVL